MFRIPVGFSRFNPFKASEKVNEKTGSLFGRFVSFIKNAFGPSVPETVVKTHNVATARVRFCGEHTTLYKPTDSPNDLRTTDSSLKAELRAELLSPPKQRGVGGKDKTFREAMVLEKGREGRAMSRAFQGK